MSVWRFALDEKLKWLRTKYFCAHAAPGERLKIPPAVDNYVTALEIRLSQVESDSTTKALSEAQEHINVLRANIIKQSDKCQEDRNRALRDRDTLYRKTVKDIEEKAWERERAAYQKGRAKATRANAREVLLKFSDVDSPPYIVVEYEGRRYVEMVGGEVNVEVGPEPIPVNYISALGAIRDLRTVLKAAKDSLEREECENGQLRDEREELRGEIDALNRHRVKDDEAFTTVYRDRNRLDIELDKALKWIRDLQSKMYVNCVYCGHRYGPVGEAPVVIADVLTKHIEQCPKHPMSALKKERDAAVELNRVFRQEVREVPRG